MLHSPFVGFGLPEVTWYVLERGLVRPLFMLAVFQTEKLTYEAHDDQQV